MGTEYPELASVLGRLSRAQRARLQWQGESALRGDVGREDRIRAAKILAALLPQSFRAIEALLAIRGSAAQSEIHFALFLFLGDLRGVMTADVDRRLLSLHTDYLLDVRTESAFAAWKVGDAIATCFPARDALDALDVVARRAKYVAGRLGALTGLEWLLRNTTGRTRERAQSIARSLCMADASARVRRLARHAIRYDA